MKNIGNINKINITISIIALFISVLNIFLASPLILSYWLSPKIEYQKDENKLLFGEGTNLEYITTWIVVKNKGMKSAKNVKVSLGYFHSDMFPNVQITRDIDCIGLKEIAERGGVLALTIELLPAGKRVFIEAKMRRFLERGISPSSEPHGTRTFSPASSVITLPSEPSPSGELSLLGKDGEEITADEGVVNYNEDPPTKYLDENLKRVEIK